MGWSAKPTSAKWRLTRSACDNGSKPSRAESSEGETHADCNSLAVKQAIGKCAAGSRASPKVSPKLRRRTRPFLALVAATDLQPSPAATPPVRAHRSGRTRQRFGPVVVRPPTHSPAAVRQVRRNRRGIRVSAACRAVPCRRQPGSARKCTNRILAMSKSMAVLPPTKIHLAAASSGLPIIDRAALPLRRSGKIPNRPAASAMTRSSRLSAR